MPLPSPEEDEKQGNFVARCVIDPSVQEDFDNADQRIAACMDVFERSQVIALDSNGACCPACAAGKSCDGGKPEGNVEKGFWKRFKGLVNNRENLEQVQVIGNMSGLVEQGVFQGEDHLIVPVVMAIGNTVMNNIFYSAEELEKFPDAWNGIPLPVHHPELNGKQISANDPKTIEEWSVGTLFNVHFEDNKLKGDAWINVEKCKEKAPEILNLLERNKDVEVSTGLFLEREEAAGEVDGVSYNWIGYNYRPDHLALLPGATGACSCEDGCGLPRVNMKEGDEEMNPEKRKALIDTLEAVNSQLFDNRNTSFTEIRDMLHDLIKNANQSAGSIWVMEVFTDPKEVVFEIWNEDKTTLFKQSFEKDEEGNVKLMGMPVEVQQVVSFEPKNKIEAPTGASETTEEGKKDMEKDTMINALIANEESSWGEDDREFLNGLNEDQVGKIHGPVANDDEAPETDPASAADEDEDADPAPDGNQDGGKEDEEEEMPEDKKKKDDDEDEEEEMPKGNASASVESYLANENIPSEVREVLQESVKTNKEIKDNMVADILKVKDCPFSNEDLQGKNIGELESLLKLAGNSKKRGDYRGQAAAAPQANAGKSESGSVGAAPTLFVNEKESSEG